MDNVTKKIGCIDFTVMPYEANKNVGRKGRQKEVWLTGGKNKSGKMSYNRVTISNDIALQAGLSEGDRVNFACSKDHTQMAFIRDKVGVFTLRKCAKNSRLLSISSAPLALDIRSCSAWGHSMSTDRFKARVIDGCVVFERFEDDD